MRITYMDGLRGVAILLVVLFHAFTRWSSILPYGETYSSFPIFEYGWLGIYLFFMISGFVIFLSLDRVESLKLFLYKRWLRLFPAMLIVSVLVYITASFLDERPSGQPTLLSLLPGLTFIEVSWWSKLLQTDIIPLEGVFWSLYVEFKFYLIAGLIYYIFGRKFLTPILFLLFVFSISISYLSGLFDNAILNVLATISSRLSFDYFGWFAAGSAFYLYYQTKQEKWFVFGLAISVLSSLFVEDLNDTVTFYSVTFSCLVAGLFAFSLKSTLLQNILDTKILVFFGFISYPLYLIHENAMVSLVIKFSEYLPWLSSVFYPIIAIAILSCISYLISKKMEPSLRRKIIATFTYLSSAKTQAN